MGFYDRFIQRLNLKIRNGNAYVGGELEKYTKEDSEKFFSVLSKMICDEVLDENKRKTVVENVNKKLLYIFDNEERFSDLMNDYEWMKSNVDFAREVVKLNPNLIFYFDENVKKNDEIVDYVLFKSPLRNDTPYPFIKLDVDVVSDLQIEDKKKLAKFSKRLKSVLKYEEENYARINKKGGSDFTNYSYIKVSNSRSK